MEEVNQFYKLNRRPKGEIVNQDLSLEKENVASYQSLKDGEVLVKQTYLSVDPTNRIWMSDADQYMPPVEIGDRMRGIGVGRVLASRSSSFSEHDLVSGLLGWQTHPVVHEKMLSQLPGETGLPDSVFLGPLGMTGATAYFGLIDIGQPKKGETLVVSAAAGAVGSMVGQIGKILGLHVVGIAGTSEKCRWLTDELGFDAAINYKKQSVQETLAKTCPDGIDIYFENVGGEILDAVLERMNLHGRIPLCGLISTYNSKEPVPGPYNFTQIIMKRLRVQGFIIMDYQDQMGAAIAKMSSWLQEGKIKYAESIEEGIENVPEALSHLFSGKNTGKQLVKLN